jgi:hypothetical protein
MNPDIGKEKARAHLDTPLRWRDKIRNRGMKPKVDFKATFGAPLTHALRHVRQNPFPASKIVFCPLLGSQLCR